ncbi:MAG: BlaI family transcriptional regulator [Ignavibacteriota bacterium]|nr:MAG: BlaI family transcriptional regulator [Ignavibacteriota bacterium]
MASKHPNITTAELKLLKILWDVGPATVRDVRDRLTEDEADVPAYTTVMTLMNQLATKGVLRVDRSRQPFVYEAVLRREQVLSARLKQFLSQVFDGQAGELVLRLIDEADLSAEDVRRIEARIEKLEEDRRDSSTKSTRRDKP